MEDKMRGVLFTLLIGVATLCQAATLDGPTEVLTGMPAVFTMKGIPQEYLSQFNWQVFNKPADAMVLDLADRQGNPVLMFWSRTSAKCAVIADVNIPDSFELIVHEFIVGDGPQPNPDPKPDPNPDPKVVFGVIIEERSDRTSLTPERAMVFESADVRDMFAKEAFQVRDDDVTDETGKMPTDIKPYIDRARKLGLPAIFLVNKNGKVLFEGAVPKDVPATLKLIQEYVK